MVPPLRDRGDVVKALLVPDLGPIRPPNPRHSLPPFGLMVNHY
ncbi:hypothetical protein V1279_002277 [Bradyrhizobium sp. AZCC 1610]